MTIAVIGAGIQGCSSAIELTLRGLDVVLFEALPRPMEGASRWNEGKIHLGYLFANDPSMRSAETMIRGALVFHGRLVEYLGAPIPTVERSSPFVYGVHRKSMLSSDEVWAHICRVDHLLHDALRETASDYLGDRRPGRSRRLAKVDPSFDESLVVSAIETPEVAVVSPAIADRMVARVFDDPRISVVAGCTIARIRRGDDGRFWLDDGTDRSHGPFQAVVNASWTSRLGLDATLGLMPRARWLHRYKLAFHANGVAGRVAIPSVTLVLGPFGDIVAYRDGRLYLSWYPVGHIATSSDLVPPEVEAMLDDAARRRIATEAVARLEAHVPALRAASLDPSDLVESGGNIVAWGDSDISDAASGLHQRHDVGVHSDRGYHSIDTGKLTLAPLHATIVAGRICGDT